MEDPHGAASVAYWPSENCSCSVILWVVSGYLLYKMVDYLIRLPRLPNTDKYVLVTGCDTGFGRHLVQRLLGIGSHVVATCLTPEGMAQFEGHGPKLKVIQMDVSKQEDIHKAYRLSLDFIPKDKGLWGIVNNAGIFGTLGPSDWLRREDFQRCLDVNILGMIDVVNAWLPLVKQAGGRVVNISSVLGRLAVPYSAPYCISKSAVQVYTSALRSELSQSRVSVHLLEPGAFKTNFTNPGNIKAASRRAWMRLSPQQQQEYGQAFVDNMVDTGTGVLQWTMSTREEVVVEAYEHALFARYPKRRYTVGLDSTVYILMSYCPDCLIDWAFSLSGILPKKPKIL